LAILTLTERRLRISTGLILATYITVHLSNHMLGLISLSAMESMREVVTILWRSFIGGLLIYGSLLTHFILALMSLYRRTTLRMQRWELWQLILGLSIIPLLAGHASATWGGRILMDADIGYESVLNAIQADGWLRTRQLLLVIVAWIHVCVGLHFFLRLSSWYRRSMAYFYPLAILVPLLVILALVRVNFEMKASKPEAQSSAYAYEYDYGADSSSSDSYGYGETISKESAPKLTPESLSNLVLLIFYGLVVLTLLARIIRDYRGRLASNISIKHINGRELKGKEGQTILEILREHKIPHASVCGGRGRCTTCRVRIGDGSTALQAPGELEQFALKRIDAAPNIRLACQTRPGGDVQITPMLPPDLSIGKSLRSGGVSGQERAVVSMFVDLRDSTKMGEKHLPYDVLFILNRFFIEMSDALSQSHGHYAQFAGDGLMALYGLKRGLKQGCLDALRGAVDMQARMNALNQKLDGEIEEPLRIGIGIHCGEAIVGSMGPPTTPNYSAIGDSINAAARLEGQSKELGCVLVVSDQVIEAAGLDFSHLPTEQVNLRGKQQSVGVYAIKNPADILGFL